MGYQSLLVSATSGVPEGGVWRLDCRDDSKSGPPALEPPVDLSEDCLVVALTEFTGVLEVALLLEALDEKVDGLTELAKGPQGDNPYFLSFFGHFFAIFFA
jgi:hypothetical protein